MNHEPTTSAPGEIRIGTHGGQVEPSPASFPDCEPAEPSPEHQPDPGNPPAVERPQATDDLVELYGSETEPVPAE